MLQTNQILTSSIRAELYPFQVEKLLVKSMILFFQIRKVRNALLKFVRNVALFIPG